MEEREAKLPEEDLRKGDVRCALGAQLSEMGGLLNLALLVVPPSGPITCSAKGIDPTVVRVVLGLYVKACKTYRATIMMAEAGLAEDAYILARTLFETMLAVAWVLQKDPSRRAQTYRAHLALRDRKYLRALQNTRGLGYTFPAQLSELEAAIDEIVSPLALEPGAVKELANTYSGASIEKTAEEVGIDQAYQLFYRYACRFAHATDLSRHINFADDGTLILAYPPTPSLELWRAMNMAYVFLRALIWRVDERLSLGHQAHITSTPGALRAWPELDGTA